MRGTSSWHIVHHLQVALRVRKLQLIDQDEAARVRIVVRGG